MPLGCSKDEHLFLLSDPVPDRVKTWKQGQLTVKTLILSHRKLNSKRVKSEKWKQNTIQMDTKRYSPNTKQVKKIATLKVISSCSKS